MYLVQHLLYFLPKEIQKIRFYCPNHNPRIIESRNARFIENDKVSGRNESWNVIIEEVQMDILLVTSQLRSPIIIQHDENVGQYENVEQHDHNVEPQDEAIQNEPIVEEP